MSDQLIENHPAIGTEVVYRHKGQSIQGTVRAVRKAYATVVNVNTMQPAPGEWVEFQVKPLDGRRAFWTTALSADERDTP